MTRFTSCFLAAISLTLLMAIAQPPPTAPPASPNAPEKAGDASNAAITPKPRDADWWREKHEAIIAKARAGGATLAFLGDSITQGWAAEGSEVWQKNYAPHQALNLGIGGDRTQHILWRLDHGLADALTQRDKPNHIKTLVLMIGTNNSNGNDHSPEEIAEGIKAIVKQLRHHLPQTKILLLAIFPRGEKPDAQRDKNAKASELASHIADGNMVHYLDIGSKFLEADGTLSKDVMPDFLHLSPRGYEIWAEAIQPKLAELMKESH